MKIIEWVMVSIGLVSCLIFCTLISIGCSWCLFHTTPGQYIGGVVAAVYLFGKLGKAFVWF